MKKLKVIYDYHDGFSKNRNFEIVEANNEDEAEEIVKNMFNCDIEVYDIVYVFDTPLNDKHIYVDMPDGFTYAIPVMVVVEDKAAKMARYSDDLLYDDAMVEVLSEFENDESAIKKWAKGEMYWSDVQKHATILKRKIDIDYQLHWANGKLEIKP